MEGKIKGSYLKDSNVRKIRVAMGVNRFKAISLQDFFDPDTYKELCKSMHNLNYKDVRQPDVRQYKVAETPKDIKELFNNKKILAVLGDILDKKIKEIDIKPHLLTWKHYQLLHDENVEEPGTDIIFDCTDRWNPRFGGSIIYVDGKGNYEEISSIPNTLSIVTRKKGYQKYIQYINNLSRETRRYVLIGTIKF